MLQLRPNCELCDKDLPVESTEACICTYECTFCKRCVETVLENVCPNCGGGFTSRPIRPNTAHRSGTSRHHQTPSSERVHSKYSRTEIAEFVEQLKDTAAADR